MRKKKWYHTADNTVLDCPKASYKYNRSTYKRTKIDLLSGSIIALVIVVIITICCNDPRIQTGCSVLGGGLLSLIIWLFTTFVTDKMAYERDELNRLINVVDKHLDMLRKNVIFEEPESYTKQVLPRDNVYASFLWLLQNCISLVGDEDIDSSKLFLSWDHKEYTLNEFCNTFEREIHESCFLDNLGDEHLKMIVWNFDLLEFHLSMLKNKLMRYVAYISSDNPPESY